MTLFWWRRAWQIPPLRRTILATASLLLLLGVGSGASHLARLSPDQKAAVYMGDHDASVSVGGVVPGSPVPDYARDAIAAGANRAGQLTTLAQIRLDQGPVVPFLESDWPESGFRSRYELLDGRWPTAPGEVVVSESRLSSATAWGARWAFTVVGHVRSTTGNDLELLSAPGTLASLTLPGPADEFPGVIASVLVAWSGGDLDQVLTVLSTTTGSTREEMRLGLSQRSDLEARPNVLFDRLPELLVPPVVGLVAAGMLVRWGHSILPGLDRQGFRRARVVRAWQAALGAWLAAMLILHPLGWQIAVWARPVWQPLVSHDLLAVPPSLASALLTGGVTLLAFVVASGLGLRQNAVRWQHLFTGLVKSAVALLVVVTGIVALGAQDPWTRRGAFMVLGVLVAAATAPAVLRVVGSVGPSQMTAVLGRRILRGDPRAAVVASIPLAVSVGLTVGLLTFAVTGVNDMNQRAQVQPVPRGAVLLRAPVSGRNVPPDLKNRFEAATGLSTPVRIFVLDGMVQGATGDLIAMPDPAAVEQWLMRPLTGSETALLENGGGLTISDRSGTTTVSTQNGPVELQLAPVQYSTSIGTIATVVLSNRTAFRVDQDGYYYTDVPAETELAMREILAGVGLDRAWVSSYRQPDTFSISARWTASLGAVGVLTSLLMVVSALSSARAVRRYGAAFLAMGLPRSWVRRVFLSSFWPVPVVGCGLGALAASASTVWLGAVERVQVIVPWAALGVWATGLFLGVVIASGVGLRRIRPAERL